jgi:hypothetical protein
LIPFHATKAAKNTVVFQLPAQDAQIDLKIPKRTCRSWGNRVTVWSPSEEPPFPKWLETQAAVTRPSYGCSRHRINTRKPARSHERARGGSVSQYLPAVCEELYLAKTAARDPSWPSAAVSP